MEETSYTRREHWEIATRRWEGWDGKEDSASSCIIPAEILRNILCSALCIDLRPLNWNISISNNLMMLVKLKKTKEGRENYIEYC